MKKCFVLVLIVFAASCSTDQNKSVKDYILKDLNAKYDKAVEFFGKDLVDHFPEKIDSLNITFTENYSPDLGNLEFFVINIISESELVSITNKFNDIASEFYGAGDSCLLVVNRFASRDNYYKIKPSTEEIPIINRECYSNKLPVPNFWHNEFTTELTDCHLPEDFKIYVIESEAGEHFEKQYLTEGDFMPVKWKNGYSKGVAISEVKQVIIYWLIIW